MVWDLGDLRKKQPGLNGLAKEIIILAEWGKNPKNSQKQAINKS